jgi:hypothetical protein
MDKLIFKYRRLYFFIPGVNAITTPWGVCYYSGDLTVRLVKHERKHWEQYNRIGKYKFVIVYCLEWLKLAIKHGAKQAYLMNKYEIEAREAENCLS